jgi:crotonobetainyl-CoA:carnitine CoA-transferase CaiB-like acyl-CoA transferase
MDNRGKRSLALDLTRPEARAALLRVIDRADVVLTNLLPGRQARFGLDPAALRARKPALVHATLNGYGTRGDEADRPAFDYTAYWARSGMMDLMRAPDATPAFLRPGVGDHAAGMSLVAGILAALRVRDRSGEGQAIEVSLLQIGLYIQGNDLACRSSRARARRCTTGASRATCSGTPPDARRALAHARWSTRSATGSEVCRALGREDLIADPSFAGPVERYEELARAGGDLRRDLPRPHARGMGAGLEPAGIIWSAVRRMHESPTIPRRARWATSRS